MALRTRLRDLSKGLEGEPKNKVVSDWIEAVEGVFSVLDKYIEEYIQDGLISLVRERATIYEDGIGEYVAPMLLLKSGPKSMTIIPVGRFIAGADGRIDFIQDKKELSLLGDIGRDGKFVWHFEITPSRESFIKSFLNTDHLVNGSLLTQVTLEIALEYMFG